MAIAIIILSMAFSADCAGHPRTGKPAILPQSPIPQDWKQQDFRVGYFEIADWALRFHPLNDGDTLRPGQLPSVQPIFPDKKWLTGVFAQLSPPKEPFGLDLSCTIISDEVCKEIARLKALHTLAICCRSEVTLAGLRQLSALKNLRVLQLGIEKVTDAELKELAGLQGLETLILATSRIDSGLKAFAQLKHLKTLVLFEGELTKQAAEDVAELANLSTLKLGVELTQVAQWIVNR
jgi:hypothetical protein